MTKTKKFLMSLVAMLTLSANVFSIAACNMGGNTSVGGNSGNNDSIVEFDPDFSGTETPDVAVEAYKGGSITITFSHCMGQTLQAAVEKYVPEFNKLYPNITVKLSKDANDYDTLKETLSTKLNGKEEYIPSVAYCYPDHVATYNRGKKVVALDPYINSQEKVAGSDEIMGLTDEQIADYYEVFYNEGKEYGDGNMYSLPFYKSTEVMYYNKTFFDANNLTVPTTWAEMETVCAKIKTIDTKCIPLGYDSESNWFITMTEQLNSGYTSATGKYFNFNNETNRDFVKQFATWYAKGYATTQEIFGKYTSNLFNMLDTSAENKLNCYMCIGSTGGAAYQVGEKVDLGGAQPEYPFEVGVAQVPQNDVNNPKVIQQGPSICLFKKSNPQEVAAAWLFAKYFTSSAAFQAYSSLKNGYTPVVKSAMQQPGYVAQLNGLNAAQGKERNAYLQLAVVQQTLDQMDTYFTTAVFKGSSKARTAVGNLMQTCFVKAPFEKDLDSFINTQFTKAIQDLEYEFGASSN